MISVLPRLLAVGVLGALWPEPAVVESVPAGKYECWFYSTPQPLHDFSLAEGSYTRRLWRERSSHHLGRGDSLQRGQS